MCYVAVDHRSPTHPQTTCEEIKRPLHVPHHPEQRQQTMWRKIKARKKQQASRVRKAINDVAGVWARTPAQAAPATGLECSLLPLRVDATHVANGAKSNKSEAPSHRMEKIINVVCGWRTCCLNFIEWRSWDGDKRRVWLSPSINNRISSGSVVVADATWWICSETTSRKDKAHFDLSIK